MDLGEKAAPTKKEAVRERTDVRPPRDPAAHHSPVHKARKFSAVLGTTSARNSMMMRPAGLPPMVMSK
jgi:hypothetical protein